MLDKILALSQQLCRLFPDKEAIIHTGDGQLALSFRVAGNQKSVTV